MSNNGSTSNGAKTLLGRGRGRSERNLDTSRASDSSESSKRPMEGQHPGTNTAKRGAFRDDVSVQIFRTKPETVDSKKGISGNPIVLTTNHFRMRTGADFSFCQYRVDFSPATDMANVRRSLLAQLRPKTGGFIYDGANIIYLMKKLPNDNNEFQLKTADGTLYKVELRWTNLIAMTDNMALNILNVLLRRCMGGLKLQQVQRNLYDPGNKIVLPELRVELWPGYITSIRQNETDILLCCEISHKVMRQENLYDVLIRWRKKSQGEGFKEAFSREVLGTVVLTDYNNRTYRVDDINWNLTPSSTFDANGTPKTYLQYYLEKYNIKIRDPRQPLLISTPKARDIRGGRPGLLCLVPELCRSTGLTDSMRSNFHTMKALGEYTRIDPEKRVRSLTDFSRRLINTQESKEQLDKHNVQLEPNLVTINARKLNQETITFGEGKTYKSDDKADWTPALRNCKMYQNVELKRWVIIYPQRAQRDVQELMKLLQEVSQPLGFMMANPKEVELPNERNETYAREVENWASKDPTLMMIILPSNNVDRYKIVKNITCINRKIPTQVVLQCTIKAKSIKSIATKIAIQMSCKIGGAPWTIGMPLSGVMCCGFDVSRDTANKSKSYGALVASMDLKKTVKFFSAIAHHSSGEECANNIEILMKKALICYRDEHGTLPERILFYRDGVGDGDIQYVREVEVLKLNELFKTSYEAIGQQPKFAFIVVCKRINTRFFETVGRRCQNPPPGTVVDDVVTLPERYDFYLISQSVRQGTVSPTSYNIIYDTFGLTPDRMQMLTYKMCHLYFNWCGTTRVPAVVQFGHKLSFLVSQFLHNIPNEGLNQKLYYL